MKEKSVSEIQNLLVLQTQNFKLLRGTMSPFNRCTNSKSDLIVLPLKISGLCQGGTTIKVSFRSKYEAKDYRKLLKEATLKAQRLDIMCHYLGETAIRPLVLPVVFQV